MKLAKGNFLTISTIIALDTANKYIATGASVTTAGVVGRPVGTVGDNIAVYLNVAATKYTIPTIRVGPVISV